MTTSTTGTGPDESEIATAPENDPSPAIAQPEAPAGMSPTPSVVPEAEASDGVSTDSNAEPHRDQSADKIPARIPESGMVRPFQSLIDLLHDLAIAVVVCVLLITYIVQAFKVQGTSMSPELLDGQRILVNKFIYRIASIERDDVVVFWYPEDPELSFIKRVIGLPGETIEVRNGDVYVDGVMLAESYVFPENADRRSFGAQEVRPGHYFVLGDNRRGSNDSRSWGLVPERYIYGKAFVRIWPPAQVGAVD